jgi:hypothetical protein
MDKGGVLQPQAESRQPFNGILAFSWRLHDTLGSWKVELGEVSV